MWERPRNPLTWLLAGVVGATVVLARAPAGAFGATAGSDFNRC